jgi:hypothetical protein
MYRTYANEKGERLLLADLGHSYSLAECQTGKFTDGHDQPDPTKKFTT